MSPDTSLPTPRARAAWRAWLEALAVDAEAAIAAALTYESLDGHAREIFLDAVDEDAADMPTPRVALYAPLLAVEADPDRRARLTLAIAMDPSTLAERRGEKRALMAELDHGERLTVLLLPLYLGFVEVLVCRWSVSGGVRSVAHEPLRGGHELLLKPTWEGVDLIETSFDDAVEDLAHAVVTSRRLGSPAPEGLIRFADLFSLRTGSA